MSVQLCNCVEAPLRKTSFADMQCSLARGLDRMGDWWSPLIIRDLYAGVVRFDELVEDLGISRNLLAQRLDALVARKLVVRRAYQRRPVRYEYTLSSAGKDLIPVILALTSWGDRWAQPREGAPVEFVHESCGKKFQPHITCSVCGKTIEADNVKVVGGPGGAVKRGTRVLARRLQAVTTAR
jgi:DNA-binding HxlR family transcriptional regulator